MRMKSSKAWKQCKSYVLPKHSNWFRALKSCVFLEKVTTFFFFLFLLFLQVSLSLKGSDQLFQSLHARSGCPQSWPSLQFLSPQLCHDSKCPSSRNHSRICYIFPDKLGTLLLEKYHSFQGNTTPQIKPTHFQRNLFCFYSDHVLIEAPLSTISEHTGCLW